MVTATTMVEKDWLTSATKATKVLHNKKVQIDLDDLALPTWHQNTHRPTAHFYSFLGIQSIFDECAMRSIKLVRYYLFLYVGCTMGE